MSSRRVGLIVPGTDVSVLVLGDADSGKSSLLESYIGGRFPADGMAPAVLDPVRLTPEANGAAARLLPDGGRALLSVNLTVVDTNGVALASDARAAAAELARVLPDAVILCYAADEPSSLVRVVDYWLPILRDARAKPHWPYIPVSLCGTKEELFDDAADAAWADAYRAVAACLQRVDPDGPGGGVVPELPADAPAEDARRAALEAVLLSFPQVQGSHHVSAREPDGEDGVLGEVGSVLYDTAFMIAFPTFPLYRPGDDEVTPEYAAAIDRIFRVLDVDRDGLLSRDEFTLFQMHVGQLRLPEAEVDAFFDTLAEERPDFVDVERRSLTPAGFAHTMKSTVLQGMNEQAWAALDAFGYGWGAVPPTPEGLSVPGATPLLPPGTGHGLHLRPFASPPLAHAAPAHRDACFVLTTPEGVNLRAPSPPPLDALRAPDARATGAGFVAGLFWQHAGGKPTLDPDDVARVFAATPPRTHPFGGLYPFTSVHNTHGGVSLGAWLGLWHMLLATNAPLALTALYELGFVAVGYVDAPAAASVAGAGGSGGGRRLSLLFDPRAAVREDVRRSRTAPFAPATTRRVAVLGSVGCGKSTLVQHAIGGSAQMQAAAAAAAARSAEDRAALSAAPLHTVVAPAPELAVTAADIEARRRVVDAAEARPGALVITEWPAHLASTALDEDNGPATDAVVFVVDAASASSIAYLLRWVDAVPDGVPTTVVATLHESRGKDANAAGLELLAKLCSDAPAVSLLTAAGAPAAVAPDASGAGEPLPASVVGLSLQLFRFVLRAPDAATRELLKFVTLRCVDPLQDNPATLRRRRAAQWQRRRRILLAGAAALAVTAAVAVVAADVGGARKKVAGAGRAVALATRRLIGDSARSQAGAAL